MYTEPGDPDVRSAPGPSERPATSSPDPASTSTEELADRVHSLAIHLLRRVRAVDAEARLSVARLSALSVVVFGGPRTVGELAAAEQVTAPTMSRLVTGLEQEGLVRRVTDARDGRRVRVVATERGRKVLATARGRRVEELTLLLEALDGPEREAVLAAVGLLEAVLESSRGG